MEAICSSKTLVDLQQTAQCYIPEDRILLKFDFIKFLREKTKLSLYMEMEHDVDHIKFRKFYMNYLMWCIINKIWMKIIYAWIYCSICIVKLWILMRDALCVYL
jgi:hypothetical protein